ncbi:MAG: DUF4124 domain-containing protein [Methylophilaceae bacterium]
MKITLFTAFITCLFSSPLIFAADNIYKCFDDSGQTVFADSKAKSSYKNCKLLLIGDAPASDVKAQPSNRVRTPTPSDFPRVDKQTQNLRDNKRKQILQDELATEKLALEESRKTYAENQTNAGVYRASNVREPGKIAKYEDNLERLKNEVSSHEKNVQLLQKELDSTR